MEAGLGLPPYIKACEIFTKALLKGINKTDKKAVAGGKKYHFTS